MAQGRKTGGRQKGTPNKPNPLKERLRAHSTAYFEPRPQTNPDGTPRLIHLRDRDGNIYDTISFADPDGKPIIISDFEVDLMLMPPHDRATIHEKLLRYHTPPLQSVSADLSVSADPSTTIEARLRILAADNDT